MKDPEAGEAIALRRETFLDAVRRHDAEAASSVYDMEAHLIAPAARPMVGREEIRAYWQAGIDAGVADVTLVADEINHNDGLAYETGVYAFRVAEPGEDGRVVERGHYVQVHKRQADGTWLRTVEIFTPGGAE